MRSRRLLVWLAMCFGFLGATVCVAGVASAWYVGFRVSRAGDKMFERIDQSLVNVRDRTLNAQRRLQESKITAQEVGEKLKNLAQNVTSQSLAARFQIEEKSTRLARGLEQADQWMELSATSMQGLKQALEMASSVGAPVDAKFFDPILAKLETLRGQLKQVTATADGISERAAQLASGDAAGERISQLTQLIQPAVATFGQIDERLGSFAEGLSAAKTRGQEMKSRMHHAIFTAELVLTLLVAWMAAGQVCLCLWGWKNRTTARQL